MANHWWDGPGWNPVAGCHPPTTVGCGNCYAAGLIATQQVARQVPIHAGTTEWRRGKPFFNGNLKTLPPGHKGWIYPLKWPGARHPVMGPGKPSLIFVCDMSDLFAEGRPVAIINRVVGTIAMSKHIGLILTKRAAAMREFFTAPPPRTIERWQKKLWLGFSAERQKEFDTRWADMRDLAASGWTIFASIAPMLAPVVLPPDFLALGDRAWAICGGEVRTREARHMDPEWARAVRDQCAAAGIAFFMFQMSRGALMPADLRIRQFPRVRD